MKDELARLQAMADGAGDPQIHTANNAVQRSKLVIERIERRASDRREYDRRAADAVVQSVGYVNGGSIQRKITAAEYEAKVGREPKVGEVERANCVWAGHIGHETCGWCDVHELPFAICYVRSPAHE